MVTIPLETVPAQSFKVVLAGQNCEIKIYYRFGSMFLDLVCNNNVIQQGAICTNRAAIVQHATNDFSGNLFFIDLLGDSAPNFDGFNGRYSLVYLSEGEAMPGGLQA